MLRDSRNKFDAVYRHAYRKGMIEGAIGAFIFWLVSMAFVVQRVYEHNCLIVRPVAEAPRSK